MNTYTATRSKSKSGKDAGLGKIEERFVYQDDELIDKAFDWQQFRRLFAYMKPYAKQMLPLIIVMTVLGTVTKLAVP